MLANKEHKAVSEMGAPNRQRFRKPIQTIPALLVSPR